MNKYKTFTFMFLSMFLIYAPNWSLNGQDYRELLVERASQNTSFWCWAASMQMVMNFQEKTNGTDRQCKLAKVYRLLRNGQSTASNVCCYDCNLDCNKSCASGSVDYNFYDLLIRFPFESIPLSNTVGTADYMDQLFFKNDYSSMQLINFAQTGNTITWDFLKAQIDDCHPFIVFISPSDSPGSSDLLAQGNHVIVGKGYYEEEVGGELKKYIIANDPWEPCCDKGHQTILPYEAFESNGVSYGTETDKYYIKQVLGVVANIFPNQPVSHGDCESCDVLDGSYGTNSYVHTDPNTPAPEPPPGDTPTPANRVENRQAPQSNGLIAALNRNRERVIGWPNSMVGDEEQEAIIKEGKLLQAPIQYVSFTKLVNASRRGLRSLDNVLTSSRAVKEIVVPETTPLIVSQIQQLDNSRWALRSIKTYSSVNENNKIVINPRTLRTRGVTLSNEDNVGNDRTKINYSIVEFQPYQWTFYRFRVSSRPNRKPIWYLAPAGNYKRLGLEAGNGYPEREVLTQIQKEFQRFAEINEIPIK